MWYTIDDIHTTRFSGFSFSGGNSALRNDYDALIRFVGYDPEVHYSAQFWAATHDRSNRLYQDLIGAAVPEPDGRTLMGVGLLAAVGLHFRRRRG
jgi:hypothetical protein